MQSSISERRQHPRVPMSGSLRWQSGPYRGEAEVLDLSPTGASFLVSLASAEKIRDGVSLELELEPGRVWRVTESAQVVQRVAFPRTCRFGVHFLDGDSGVLH